MAKMTVAEALAHADVHAVPGHAQSVLAAEVRRQQEVLALSFVCSWWPVSTFLPDVGDDVLVTILIDGVDEAWHAGFWDGVSWYVLDTEHDEPIEVNAGCNFVVTHWTRVVTAGGRGK